MSLILKQTPEKPLLLPWNVASKQNFDILPFEAFFLPFFFFNPWNADFLLSKSAWSCIYPQLQSFLIPNFCAPDQSETPPVFLGWSKGTAQNHGVTWISAQCVLWASYTCLSWEFENKDDFATLSQIPSQYFTLVDLNCSGTQCSWRKNAPLSSCSCLF